MNQSNLIVDGHAMAYRAFYGVRDLSTADGRPTNALYGFIRMLRQLEDKWKPDRVVVTFDGGIPASRLEKCPAYKAQRKPMPEELRSQMELIREYLERAGLPRIRLEQEEADDVMGTLAVRAAAEGDQVRIATSDKDLMQLVTDRVHLVPPQKATQELDPDGVLAKTGVRPEQIVEWLALIGDVADNIPGVMGIGPKTASMLLSRFGTMAACYERLEEVSSKSVREKLEAGRSVMDLNVELMTLNLDVEGVPAWADIPAPSPNRDALLSFYEQYELHRFAAELAAPAPAPASPPKPPAGDQLSLF